MWPVLWVLLRPPSPGDGAHTDRGVRCLEIGAGVDHGGGAVAVAVVVFVIVFVGLVGVVGVVEGVDGGAPVSLGAGTLVWQREGGDRGRGRV